MARVEYQFVPLVSWPGKMTAQRQRSRFRAGTGDTNDLLDRELAHLGATNVVLQVALQPGDIRLDGRPRANSRPSHPGVVLSFDSKHGPLSYPCDAFTDWQDNLRAIALSLEHLRAVDRYGVTKRGEQYKGWTALPPPPKVDPMTVREAADVVAAMVGVDPSDIVRSADAWAIHYRAAAKVAHPDSGGRPGDFQRLQAAAAILDRHHGV